MMSLGIPKSALGIAAGIGGLLFVGYCIYFDQKRHSDPSFKKKLREKRRQKRLAKSSGTKIPDLRDQESVQKFFLSEVQLGETLLSQGDVEGAVEHLGSAIAVYGYPQQLLQILQRTLPPQVFHLLLQRLPMIGQSVHARHQASFGAPVGSAGSSQGMPGPIIGLTGAAPPQFLPVEDELE